MPFYKPNFEQLKEAYAPIFQALERACKKVNVDFYLIGAQSREVWIKHLKLPTRTTRDIDYCVYVKDWETWSQLNEFLVKEEGFVRDKAEPYRFYKEGIIDLIPFGGVEQNGEVVLDNPPTEVSVYGCKEVAEEAVILEGAFKLITLPGLCILKLVAYSERPENRRKDFDDFLFLAKNYDTIADEEIFMAPYSDLLDNDFDSTTSFARILGRQMQTILNKNDSLKSVIVAILKQQLKGFELTEVDQMYKVRERDDELVLQLKLIAEVIRGAQDE